MSLSKIGPFTPLSPFTPEKATPEKKRSRYEDNNFGVPIKRKKFEIKVSNEISIKDLCSSILSEFEAVFKDVIPFTKVTLNDTIPKKVEELQMRITVLDKEEIEDLQRKIWPLFYNIFIDSAVLEKYYLEGLLPANLKKNLHLINKSNIDNFLRSSFISEKNLVQNSCSINTILDLEVSSRVKRLLTAEELYGQYEVDCDIDKSLSKLKFQESIKHNIYAIKELSKTIERVQSISVESVAEEMVEYCFGKNSNFEYEDQVVESLWKRVCGFISVPYKFPKVLFNDDFSIPISKSSSDLYSLLDDQENVLFLGDEGEFANI